MTTNDASSSRAPADHTQHASLLRYFAVWAALTALTFLTFGLSRVNLGAWHVVVALTIAAVKAGLVFLFFMHLWESRGTITIVVLVTLLLLLLLIGLTIADVTGRFGGGVVNPSLGNEMVR